jgi:phage terminase large subunit-like protein
MSELARLKEIEKTLKEVQRLKTERAMTFYSPYPKQMEFHDQGSKYRERLFMAGNRVGKTFCGAFEMACHLTGEYPDWWLGRRFNRPIKAWAASDTGLTTRDIVQTKLCGPYGYPAKYGTGMIPKDAVDWTKEISLARGVTDLFDTVLVTHKTDGVEDGKSVLTFKSYEQGRKKWQGEAVDVIWYDEEPEEDIYAEGTARIAPTIAGETGGIEYMTFTPLLGKSKVVCRFTDEKSDDRGVIYMTIDDATHISPEARAKIISGYLPHEREARTKGVPMLGSGKIFQTLEQDILVPPFALPRHWRYLWGTDFGIEHPFAAVLLGVDMDTDTIYVMQTVRMTDSTPLQHVAAMKPCCGGWGDKVPMSWPQDGWQRKEFEGALKPTSEIYRKHKMNVLHSHATFVDGTNSTHAGIIEMQERFSSNRLKVFSHCTDWLEEYRNYHMKDGQIVKLRDDLMSATRVGVMARRFAKAVLWVPNTQDGRGDVGRFARDVDCELF